MRKPHVWPLVIFAVSTLVLGTFGLPAMVVLAEAIGKPTSLATSLFYVGGWMALIFAPRETERRT